MVKQIIDAIIDNYERKLVDARDNAGHASSALRDMRRKYEKADDANIELRKERDQLKHELVTAKLDRLQTMDHLIAAVSFIPASTGEVCIARSPGKLRDALYAIPTIFTTLVEQTHIAALAQAIDRTEEPG